MRVSRKLLVLLACAAVAAATVTSILATDGGDSRDGSSPGPRSKTIPQPLLGGLNTRTRRRLAPLARRIDLAAPSFSDRSTPVTNPLFPVSELRSVILVGKLGGVPWRAETTLLPRTDAIAWNGMRVRTLRSQFVAYLGGRIFEVAVDRYAQAEDGSVWYFGEDAFSYERGRVVDTEGTWLAGVDGPPALIMPAHPHVGDVYRTENIPGLVFEEVTVERVGQTVNGPLGPVGGAMIGRELHMDEARLEQKTFAPGYGELFSGGGQTFEANALAVPTDTVKSATPPVFGSIFTRAVAVYQAARRNDWGGAARELGRMRPEVTGVRQADVPPRLAVELRDGYARLVRSVEARNGQRAGLAALDVANASLDLQLQYRRPNVIDAARLGLWTRRLSLDAAHADRAGVIGDVAVLELIRERIRFANPGDARIDDELRVVRASAEAGELANAARAAGRLRALLRGN